MQGERLAVGRLGSTPPPSIIASRSVNIVRHPRAIYMVIPIAVFGVATPENEVTHWCCHPQARKQAQDAEVRLTSGS